jgi:hypothetical protein
MWYTLQPRSRGRGARNSYGDGSFDYRHRSGKSTRMGCARHGHSDTQVCYAGRRVATYLHSTIQRQEDPYLRGAHRRAPRLLPLLRHAGSRPKHERRRRTPLSFGRQTHRSYYQRGRKS